ncbi:MAG TPA: hypothetical protein VGY58_19225, partial [Gemmataceae bacterium]|nr:hypothetical protein [Gemmataceae bacterium]
RSLVLEENNSNWHINGNHVVHELQAVCRQGTKQVEALKLVYSNRRILTIEVPFTLKDVPLP